MEVLLMPLDVRRMKLGLFIIAMNILDTFATLRHIEHGCEELNPAMDTLLHMSVYHFVIIKYLMVAVGVIGIITYPRQTIGRASAWVLAGMFSLLGIFQISLFFIIRS